MTKRITRLVNWLKPWMKSIMSIRIRVMTRAAQFEKRKQEHLEAGYQIEDEQPVPVNGICSFVAVRIIADEDDPVLIASDEVIYA